MKIDLNILERAKIADVMPPRGNYLEQKITQRILKAVELSPEELKEIGFRIEGEKAFWTKEKVVAFEFDEVEEAAIVKALREKDSRGEITQELITLYEKFILKG